MKKLSRLLPLIGIVIFIYIILNINVSKVVESFLSINHYFVIGMLIFGATIVMRAFRWKVIVGSYGIDLSLPEALKGWIIGFAIGLITPGKIGDLSRSYYLKEKTKIGKSLTTVMADRLIDVLVLFILALIGISSFVTFYVKNDFLLVVTYSFFAVFIVGLFLFSRKRIASFFLRPFYRRLIPEGKKQTLKTVYDDFYSGVEVILRKKMMMIGLILFTFFIWAVIIFYLFLFAEMLNLGASYHFLFIIFPLVTLILILPISFSGLGTKDVSLVFFLSYVGVSPEAAISFSLIHLFSDYLMAAIGFGLWYKNPIKLRG